MDNTELNEPILIGDKLIQEEYDKPEIISYVVENKNLGKSYQDIVTGLKARGFDSITDNTVKNIYKTAYARSIRTSNTAKKEYEEFTKELVSLYGQALELMKEYIKNMREINTKLNNVVNENGDVDILQTKLMVAKTIPMAIGLLKEIREYNAFQADLAEKIEQTQEIGMTSSDVLKEINQQMKDEKHNILENVLKIIEKPYTATGDISEYHSKLKESVRGLLK